MPKAEIQFLGAARSVTGSKFLLTVDGRRLLVDCGLFQGKKKLRLRNWNDLPVDPGSIDAILLTHAHVDHTGYLPRVVRQGFAGPVFCTPATRELLGILLPDAGYLQEEEARFANKKGFSKHSPALPLYTREEAQHSLGLLRTLDYGRPKEIVPGVTATLHPNGHILGSAFAQLDFLGKRMILSGDLGSYDRIVMASPADLPKEIDYIAVESTYGGRSQDHAPIQEQLRRWIAPTLDRGGVVVIPAFAIGRTTLVLYHIRQLQERGEISDVPVFVDSPMATHAVKIYRRYRFEHNLKVSLLGTKSSQARALRTHLVRTADRSKRLNDMPGPAIIISASGMATGGRILHHLKNRLPDPKNLVLLVGYQAAGTRGRRLLEGAGSVKIHGEEVPVKARVGAINGLSAHGDSDDIIRWLKTARNKPKMTFLIHGEMEGLKAQAKRVASELKWPYRVPDYLEKISL